MMINKLKTYFTKKILITVIFGLSSGLPIALVFGTLSLWLKDYNIAYRTIGAFSLLRLPYSFKWVWAPMVEKVKLPFFSRLGKRRGWALFAQIGLLLSLVWISCLTPDQHILCMAVAAFLISFFSATQDIVLDAFRVELYNDSQEQEVNGVTVYVLGYRIGNLISGAGAIGLAYVLSWGWVYFINALLVILGIVAVLISQEPEVLKTEQSDSVKGSIWKDALVEPFKKFVLKPYWLIALLIVFSYRLGDAYFAPMAYPFYSEMGFSKLEIAYISKLYGMAATIIGGLLGGYILAKCGLMKGLILFAVLQGVTTFLYVPLYYLGHNISYLMFTIALENLSSGMASIAIIAFMSSLCDKGYTATQYALLSSLPGFSRDIFASTSGWVLDMTSWPVFFIISGLMAVPALILSIYLCNKKVDYLMKA